MNDKQLTRISRFLSLVLRHKPETIGLSLDQKGWANTATLLKKLNANGKPLTMAELEFVVDNNNKKRFAFNESKTKIRASQGHSLNIDLGYTAQEPPEVLYHGTATKHLHSIRQKGLIKGSRHHVHLSLDKETAINVGTRYGFPALLIIQAREMHQDGYKFFVSENEVWLTDHVPVKYIDFRT